MAAAVSPVASAAPAKPSSQAESIAAESLLFSAERLYHWPEAPARAGRLVVTGKYLLELAPDNLQVQRLLCDLYQSQGHFAKAAEAAKKVLDAHPNDYSAGFRWLRFELQARDNASERTTLLRRLLDSPKLPLPLRANAALGLANIFQGQGAKSDALAMVNEALKLDPYNHDALLSRLALAAEASAKLRVETMLRLLRCNPRAWWVARQLAGQLCRMGLTKMGVRYYKQAWELWQGDTPLGQAPAGFACEYLSALLDAGEYVQAIKDFAPAMERLSQVAQFQSLMVEAYRMTNQEDRAKLILRGLGQQYRSQLTANEAIGEVEGTSEKNKLARASIAMNLGWYYLLAERKSLEALRYARKAKANGATGEAIKLLIGAAELSSGNVEGLKKLKPLIDTHALAAAFVAEHDFEKGDGQLGRRAVLAGMNASRSGLAYRILRALAKKHKVAVPPAKDAKTIQALMDAVDRRFLQLGLTPQLFINVKIQPVKSMVSVGQPMYVKAILTNKSEVPITIGSNGLLDNRLGLVVNLKGQSDRPLVFASVPVIILPAPRYLPPGKSVTGQVRLDVGSMALYLPHHPLEAVKLEIRGVVSPREKANCTVSDLPMIKPAAATITRMAMLAVVDDLDSVSPRQYNNHLRAIEKTLTDGKLKKQVLAVRRIGSLICWMRDVQQKRATFPAGIASTVKMKILLGLMTKALQNPRPIVRAEMVASLADASLDGEILNRLGAVIEDPSPLVRFRIAEVIGASGTAGSRQLVELYAKDTNKLVAGMATAYLRYWRIQAKRKKAARPKRKKSAAGKGR